MTGTSTNDGGWRVQPGHDPACLFATSVKPLTFCEMPREENKIYCKLHIGEKHFKPRRWRLFDL